MRHEKAEILLRIALHMQGSTVGLSLDDIRTNYSDAPLGRRTAERLRDALERLFPALEQANPGETPKRWRLPPASLGGLANITAAELATLATAAETMKRQGLAKQADEIASVVTKARAAAHRRAKTIEPDLEGLASAEGLAMRPGPRTRIDPAVFDALRAAILACRKVRIDYLYRSSRRRGHEIVHPYGFVYGNRHYLVAWSEKARARDFRTYALSNIETVTVQDEAFVRADDFDLTRYASQAFGTFHEEPTEIVWRFTPQAASDAAEFLFHPTQTTERESDGALLVRFRAGGLQEMAWHLMTWGDQVEVVAPAKLRTMLAEQCRHLARHHGGPGAEMSASSSAEAAVTP